jgi:hypothetical protein
MATQEAHTQAANTAAAVRENVQAEAGDAVEKGRGALRRQVDSRSTQMGQQAQSAADVLRQTAIQVRESGDQQQARYAQAAEAGADRLDRVGTYLRNSDADELLSKLEDGARRQPWLVAGVGLLAGIAAARFLKASSTERYYRSTTGRESANAWQPDHRMSELGESRPLVPAGPAV